MGLLLDRDAELGELDRRIATARSGSGRVIVVEGPAGIGKSTLLAAAGRIARADGATVLSARCSPLEQHAAWGTARQLFEPLRTRPEWNELTIGAAGLAERALAPEGAAPAPAGDAMHAAARGLVWLVSNIGERGPTVLIVDDVHWADAPSVRWLALLAGSIDELRVGLLCAVRAGEPAAAPELLAELFARVPDPPVRPRALGPAATETLVRQRLPAASAGFANACHAVTGGNPFLLGALLTQLIADGATPNDETAARLATFGSEQVGRVIERQLARLPDGAGPLAEAVAVLGPGAPLRRAAAVAGLTLSEAARAADSLRAAGLLEETSELTLAHPLIAGTIYNNVPAGARALRHADAAALLVRERAEPERVALHLLRTEPASDPATVAALRDAATRAAARGAPQTAVTYLRRALAEPPASAGEHADVQLHLALALAAYMHPDALELLHQAVATADTAIQRGTIALAGARACGLAGHFDAAISLCRSGLEAGALPPELQARLEAELIADGSLHAATVPEARERVRRIASSPPPLALWRINAAWASACDARPASEAVALLTSALDAEALVHDSDSLLGTVARFILIASGELDAARRHCAELIDLARPRGWLIALAHGCFMRAIALVRAGEMRDAEADARLSLDIKLTHSPPEALIWSVFPLVDALTELGAFDDAESVLAQAGYHGDPPAGALAAPLLLEARARLRLGEQRHALAHADLLAAAERWNELGIRHPDLAAWRVHACETLLARGERHAARDLAEEHLVLAEQVTLPGPRGAGLRALARTADREQAVGLLEQAVEQLAGSSAQLEHTRALVDLGAALRRANRRAAARTPLRRALELADRGGMRLLAARARHELNALGARPRRSALSGIDSLTPAEHRVATLAAQGHTNPQIAQQLYVTRRTVETHLTHVFQKLDLATRTDLTSHFAGPGPPDRAETLMVS